MLWCSHRCCQHSFALAVGIHGYRMKEDVTEGLVLVGILVGLVQDGILAM
jgi:hypothetical protein